MGISAVGGIMRQRFVVADPDDLLDDARQTLRLTRMRHLLVTRDRRLLGIVSYREILESLLASAPGGARSGPRTVAELMKPAPVCVRPETSLATAVDCMCRHGLGCLPVVAADDSRSVVGLLTETDLLRAASATWRNA
jgi:CBS domain-containing protein